MADKAGEEVAAGGESRRQFRQMLAIGLIASIVGVALGLLIDWFPVQAAGEADDIDTLYDVLIVASVPIFVLVAVVVLFSVWKFRMRPGEEDKDGPPIHGNTRLEVIWTVLPAILLVSLCSYAYVVLRDVEQAQAEALKVRVIGEQFTWTFEYPAADGEKAVVSNQLYLPQGRPVDFDVVSKDVIHDFWVPAFRLKIDAVPGITTDLKVTPTRRGSFPVVCAELCGLGHSAMRQTVHVVPPPEFEEWLEEERTGGAAPAGGPGGEGPDPKQLFADNGCGACHVLADAGTTGQSGPVLDESLRGKDASYVKRGIIEPDADIAEGFSAGVMPKNFGETMSPEEVDALTEYLVKVTNK